MSSLDFFIDLMTKLGGAGWLMAALMFWLFNRERTARDNERQESIGLVREFVSASKDVTGALAALREAIKK